MHSLVRSCHNSSVLPFSNVIFDFSIYLFSYLEESTSVVYSDLNIQNAPALESRSYMPPILSYAVIVPALQVVIRSIAYTNSVDIGEHNIPGYHLIPESAYSSVVANVSGEKASTTSTIADSVSSVSPVDPTLAPWCYIKKYSVGIDEYRYLGKTIDAVACTLQSFDCLDLLNHSVMLMLTGNTYTTSVVRSPSKASTTTIGNVSTWLPLPLNSTYSSKVPIQMRTTPLLATPLLDVLVFSMALAIAAPSAASPPVESPTRSRIINTLHNVQYNPVWNIDHCVRWLCMAKLVQLLYTDIEQFSGETIAVGDGNSADVKVVFAEWSSIAPFQTTLYTKMHTHYATSKSTDVIPLSNITTERAKDILLQWLSFIRAAVHILYRNDSTRYTNTNDTNDSVISPPEAWLNSTAGSLLLQNHSDVTDAQVVKHLTLVSMTDMLSSDTPSNSSAQDELLTVAMLWVEDYAQNMQHVNTPTSDNVGVLTHNEVSDWLRTNNAEVVKPSADTTTSHTSTCFVKHSWPFIRHSVYSCYPRASRPALISLPKEYTKLHALVMGIISTRAGGVSGASPNKSDNISTASSPSTTTATTITITKIDNPAMCLVCGAIMDGAGKGQCAAHTMQCCGEAGVFFLVQVQYL